MKSKKTGVSMGGTIEYTRDKRTKIFILKKDTQKKKRSKICIDCENNNEGFCKKHKNWCGKVNYICLGINNPYKNISKSNKNKKKKRNKQKPKQVDNVLGQVVKPNFNTTGLVRKR